MDADEYTALGGRLDMAQIDGWYERFEDIEIDPTFQPPTCTRQPRRLSPPIGRSSTWAATWACRRAGLPAVTWMSTRYDLCGEPTTHRPGVTGRATRSTSSRTSRHGWARTLGSRRTPCLRPACHGTSGSWTDYGRAGAIIGPSGIRGNPPKGMALGLRHRRREAGR